MLVNLFWALAFLGAVLLGSGAGFMFNVNPNSTRGHDVMKVVAFVSTVLGSAFLSMSILYGLLYVSSGLFLYD